MKTKTVIRKGWQKLQAGKEPESGEGEKRINIQRIPTRLGFFVVVMFTFIASTF